MSSPRSKVRSRARLRSTSRKISRPPRARRARKTLSPRQFSGQIPALVFALVFALAAGASLYARTDAARTVLADDAAPVATDTAIVTGDATADSSATTEANVIAVNSSDPAPQVPQSIATSSDPEPTLAPSAATTTVPDASSAAPDATITASSTNVADASTTLDVSASTSGNAITGAPGTASISTGSATAATNIVNVVNANIFDSQGLILFLNNLVGDGNLNLSALLQALNASNASSTCSLTSCGAPDTSLNISDVNTVDITNNAIARASSGGNSIDGAGDASITTGDANAAANVVNVANTNIVDSNYLMLVVNDFGGRQGDVVLPSASIFSHLFPGGFSGPVSASNNNSASVTNNVDVQAGTGGNSAGGADSTSSPQAITTGDASASASVINETNDSVFADNPFVILFQIHGSWNGSVTGLPDGVTWQQTPGGLMLYSAPGATAPDFGTTTIASTSTTNIVNNVHAYALTGENEISDASGTSAIATGDAHAAASIINVANTNIIGTNWLLAIINIFGDWNGNVAFGMPDLWIGGRSDVGGTPGNGSPVSYTFTVTNNGDETAKGAYVTAAFDPSLLSVDSVGQGGDVDGTSTIGWTVGELAPHATMDLTFSAHLASSFPFDGTPVTVTGAASETGPDANPADNTDAVTFVAGSGIGRGTGVLLTPMPKLSVEKKVAQSSVAASSTVDFDITITNDSNGPAYDSIFIDELKDAKGKLIHKEMWPLATIKPHEKIELSYTAALAASTTPGTYTTYGQVKAIGGNPSLDPFYGWFASSNIATTSVAVSPFVRAVPQPPSLPLPTLPQKPKPLALAKPHAIAVKPKNMPIATLLPYVPGLPEAGGEITIAPVQPVIAMTSASTSWPGDLFSKVKDLFGSFFGK